MMSSILKSKPIDGGEVGPSLHGATKNNWNSKQCCVVNDHMTTFEGSFPSLALGLLTDCDAGWGACTWSHAAACCQACALSYAVAVLPLLSPRVSVYRFNLNWKFQ